MRLDGVYVFVVAVKLKRTRSAKVRLICNLRGHPPTRLLFWCTRVRQPTEEFDDRNVRYLRRVFTVRSRLISEAYSIIAYAELCSMTNIFFIFVTRRHILRAVFFDTNRKLTVLHNGGSRNRSRRASGKKQTFPTCTVARPWLFYRIVRCGRGKYRDYGQNIFTWPI